VACARRNGGIENCVSSNQTPNVTPIPGFVPGIAKAAVLGQRSQRGAAEFFEDFDGVVGPTNGDPEHTLWGRVHSNAG
jgi:hypothetical protein